MNQHKLLFLDIDGVMNSIQSELTWDVVKKMSADDWDRKGNLKKFLSSQFDLNAITNLLTIVNKTDCKIVISSTWRKGCDIIDMRSWFPIKDLQTAIIGKTPDMANAPKGHEILKYIDSRKYSLNDLTFVALGTDIHSGIENNSFWIDDAIGLDLYTTNEIIKSLNRSDYELV